MEINKSFDAFRDGLVFGFDVGTGSIGHAVRRGSIFLDVGVLICDSEVGDNGMEFLVKGTVILLMLACRCPTFTNVTRKTTKLTG